MGMPAARVTDMHTCPMVTVLVPHVGGPILPPCAVTVLIGGLPAARVMDMCVCVGPPDMIVKGSATVLIMGKPAARIGDTTTHGGVIITGQANVLIGDAGSGEGGGTSVASGGASESSMLHEAGSSPTKPGASPSSPVIKTFGTAITIDSNDSIFIAETLAALEAIKNTSSGKAMFEALEKSKKKVKIISSSGGNKVNGFTAGGKRVSDGTKGIGSDSVVHFNSNRTMIGKETWETRPPAIGLAHELVHATHLAQGDAYFAKVSNDSKPDASNPKVTAQEIQEEVRTAGIKPYDKEPFSENSIRSEWHPQQPERKWY